MEKREKSEEFPLHQCVFFGDVQKLSSLLPHPEISLKDKHGNTPLHLAVMLGRKECVNLLLDHGAQVKGKNLAGWSPLAEAISYGDRDIVTSLVLKLKEQTREKIKLRRQTLVQALETIEDFYMALKWDFHSWVPLVSRILPSDVCKIYKSGSNIRLDVTLVDFNDMKWERGDMSLVFEGAKPPGEALTILDNKNKVYHCLSFSNKEAEIESDLEHKISKLMSKEILSAHISTKGVSFINTQTGWIFKEDRKETVAGYNSDIYTIKGLVLETRKRREHLLTDDLQRGEDNFKSIKDNASNLDESSRRRVDWDTYISSAPAQYPSLSKEPIYKEFSKEFKATVAMSDEFPLTIDTFLNILEVIAPFKHFAKLRQFVTMKLPKGFPVKLNMPVLPTVTAEITFQEFKFCEYISPDKFIVPSDFEEDIKLVPGKDKSLI